MRDIRLMIVAVLLAGAQPSAAQQADLLLSKGVFAYEDVWYDSASTLLRRALSVRGADSLDTPRRARALTYLAASEVYRGRRDSSVAIFRRLLQESPRRLPDTLVFPPPVTSVYMGVRASLHGVARIRSTPQGVDLIIVAFTAHRLGVGVRVHDGDPVRSLFDGSVSDSIVVSWDGKKDDGTMAPNGAYDFVLIAFGPKGEIAKAVRFPVVLDQKDATAPPRPRSLEAPPLFPLTGLGGDAVELVLEATQRHLVVR
jgi:hypothetical protein